MSGTIELDRDGRSLLIRFPYDKYLVEEVKALPGRRWDPARKVWKFPAENAELIVTALMKYGFAIDSGVSAILAGTVAIPPPPDAAAPDAPAAGTTAAVTVPAPVAIADPAVPCSVSDLNTRVREAITRAFPERVKVIGEVTNFDKNRERRHLFFSLVEKEPGGGKIRATVDVALFDRTAQKLLKRLEQAGLNMRDGIEILAEVKVDLYPATGRYQLIVEDIHPEFTLGQLALSREQILLELRKAGVERRNLELPMPVPALRIGVLTSPDSDGWNDFLQELRASGIGFAIDLFPVRVQGEELRPTVLRGLKWFARRAAQFDVLCILRGGGSRTDLAWFDDRDVAFAVANHPLKVIVGIGHERDRSVLDEIARSVKTPTGTAACLVDHWHATMDELRDLSRCLAEAARKVVRTERERLSDHAHTLLRGVRVRFVSERHRLGSTAHRLTRGSHALVRDAGRTLEDRARRIQFGSGSAVRRAEERLSRACELLSARGRYRIDRARQWLEATTTRQRLLDPARVLARGYAMLRDADGRRIVTDATGLSVGGDVHVALRDGDLRARIQSIQLRPPEPKQRDHGRSEEEA